MTSNKEIRNPLDEKIRCLIEKHRQRIVIAAHHYQSPDIVRYADIIGDSYKLAVDCSHRDADFIIMCGVRFMAEGAAVLAAPGQRVVMPDTAAGCPMADMITAEQTQDAVNRIRVLTGKDPAPVVYMNSTAAVKAVCGRAGGAVCTSSNARKILTYFFGADRPVFFAPDRHLGLNTVTEYGMLDDSRIAFIGRDGKIECGGDPARAGIFLWDGFCPVHKQFTPEQVVRVRKDYPGISVVVHPECDAAVVEAADADGSTEFLLKTVSGAASGTAWAVGTELSFVTRLAGNCPDKTVVPLESYPCTDMSLITPDKLAATLENIDRVITSGEPLANEIRPDAAVIADAARALERMIAITEGRL